MKEMREMKGLRAGTVSYTALISALGRAGQCDAALKALASMQDERVRPNTMTYR
jgi:pentatricopeptide repeat protein